MEAPESTPPVNPPPDDPLAATYAAIPYFHGAIPHTHPARIGAIARLHGLAAALPDQARVLELGCGEGRNLLPLAERLPRAALVGVDLGAEAIARGEGLRAAAHLENVQLQCADLRDWTPDGVFDYVIAHGIYSWVSPEVRDRLLAMIRDSLAPAGVAYVSYNTQPGWALPAGVRTLLSEEIRHLSDPRNRLARALEILRCLEAALRNQTGPYAAHLHATIQDMLSKPPSLFFHDELELFNDPCTFTEFVEHANAYGLHYLAEAHYATMPYEHVPAESRAALASLNLDFLREQRFLDVLYQRWLRASLLTRIAPDAVRRIDPTVIAECAVGSRLQAASHPLNVAPGVAEIFTSVDGLQLSIVDRSEKAFLGRLAKSGSDRIPFREALAGANQLLHEAGQPPIVNVALLCSALVRLFALDAIDLLLLGDGAWLQLSAEPAPSALMRLEAEQGGLVTNRWHEPITLTPEGAQHIVRFSGGPDPGAFQAGLLV